MPSPHEVLGVPRGASRDQIRRAYRVLARRFHPDVSGTPESAARFAEIARAYEQLTSGHGPEPVPDAAAPDPSDADPAVVYDAFFQAAAATPRRPQTRFRPRTGTSDLELEYPISPAEAARGLSPRIPIPGGQSIAIRVPPGVRDGEQIRLPSRGMRRARGQSGDLIVIIRVVRGSGDDLTDPGGASDTG